jgi:hypothetical protein
MMSVYIARKLMADCAHHGGSERGASLLWLSSLIPIGNVEKMLAHVEACAHRRAIKRLQKWVQ